MIAKLPELPGCVGDGPIYQAALEQVDNIIDKWPAIARELGRFPSRRGGFVIKGPAVNPRANRRGYSLRDPHDCVAI